MLFYETVTVVADRGSLHQLIREVGVDPLWNLVDDGFLTIEYRDAHLGVLTENTGTANETHRPTDWSSDALNRSDALTKAFEEATGRPSKARRLARSNWWACRP